MRGFYLIAVAMLLTHTANAQGTFDVAAKDAFVITRMAQKFHLQPKPTDKTFSVAVFDRLMSELDEDRMFLTMEDMNQLLPFRLQLDEEVNRRKTGFIKLLASLYERRLRQVDTLLDELTKAPFDFTAAEKLAVTEDTSYPANGAALKIKLRKLIKANVLDILTDAVQETPGMTPAREKKFVDSLEIVYRKKVQSYFKRSIKRELESPGGISQFVGERYCEVIATYYDPHTNYLSLTNKENLESELGEKSMMFGFGLDSDDEEQVVIDELLPGSPAFQSGQLNEGDKILAIQWEGKSEIDVSDASLREVATILEASNHDKVKFTIQKADGSKRTVELAKAKMEDDEDGDKVKSFVLQGSKPVGYISLPAFYSDWENEENNVNGCANDVAREILKLKKENIEALVLDLRYNGGGSVQEAIELAGIFIDAGPLAMIKDRGEKVFTLKDVSRGTIWDGPLLVMINGFSASASEMVAGTLQDYNRAIVVGATSYGKGTGQNILPMDTTINLEKDFSGRQTGSFVKMTMSKLYRINGTTAQFAGVQPDVVLPDIIDADPQRESNEPFAIPSTGMEGNKYYRPLSPISKDGLQQFARRITDTAAFFKALAGYVALKKAERVKKDVSLEWKQALQLKKAASEIDVPAFALNKHRTFTVRNNQLEEQRLQANKDLEELNKAWRTFLERDPYLQVTYGLAIQLIK